MKRLCILLFLIFSLFTYSFDVVITDYYDDTFGDYIPESLETINYSNACFYVVSDLGNVTNGESLTLKVTYPDGSESEFNESVDFDGEGIFYKRVDLKGVGNYKVELTFNNETEEKDFTVNPDKSEDPFEPNNFEGNVFYLERGTILSSLISQEDIDYYSLKIDRKTDVKISLDSDIDLSLEVFDEGNLIAQSDSDFEGDESLSLSLERGIYTVKVYSPIKETGDYSLTVKGNFPIYLPLTDFDRSFEKNIVVSNLSDKEGDVEIHFYDADGQEVSNTVEHFKPYETKSFDGSDYYYLKAYSDNLEVNASAYGINGDKNEAIGYEAKILALNNTIVSHIATQTYLYETFSYFSFNDNGTFLNYGSDVLSNSILENSSFLVNFNQFYNDNILTPWGIAESDAEFCGIEMFRLIGGDFFQATALTLTPQVARVFFLPHIDVRYFWWTGISIVNPNNMQANVKLIALDSDGNSVGEADISIEPEGKSVGIVTDYFENDLPETAAAMKIVSDLPVQGLYLFGTKRGDDITEDVFGGLNSSAIYSKKLYFALMPSGDNEWTGIGIFNPNNEGIEVNLKGFDSNGNLIEEKTINLTPLQKYVSLGKDIFDSEGVYRMIAVSDKPICGFYLFGDRDHTYLYGLEAMR
ncbi:hypothetical protein TTHT_1297 [Thermotomaculum hydrothermale]|uniref:Peptidase C-terminal archaeal/bacterial domain-containing protein n=1 Tax=Thermotomaculum hydrothermale TaxID=981385 RepID=A0A7R6PHP6_9BACT|nr:hypothetical protein [Thermotomaculum hydrothermale]BBB32814.1 hypothetical protein TTHT_1297 [Thermotomaculum hydrothermale]